MAQFSCAYCSACPRHGCDDEEEASRCPNQDNKGMYLNFDAKDVSEWLRYNASMYEGEDILLSAADALLDR